MSMRLRLTLFTFAAAAVCALVVSCATNPVTGRSEFSLVSTSQELQIGQEGYKAMLAEYGTYDANGLGAYVDSIGQKLARQSQLPNLEWHFTLLDDPVVNAFAMPGGYIYITRGILADLGSEAQLAGVLGHEIGHVTSRHTAHQITMQQVAGLGLGLASVLSESFRQYSGPAQQAMGLLFLKYSRDNENQADALGVQYSTAANWDPREIPHTYEMLARVGERSGQRLPSFLSTHPDPGDRQQRTQALANQAAQGKTGLIVRQKAFLEHLDGIVYGEDPRQGYFEGDHYYHPELSFEMTFPSGWLHQNGRAQIVAAEPQQKAMLQIELAKSDAMSPQEFVTSLQRKGAVTEASGNVETVGGYSAWVGRLLVPQQNAEPITLVAGFLRQGSDRMFQMLGKSAVVGDADESKMIATIRSFRPLSDPRRANPTAARLEVAPAPAAGPFREVVTRLGTPGVPLEELSVINNMDLDQSVMTGQILKSVQAARLR